MIRKKLNILPCVLIYLILLPGLSFAQQTSGNVKGHVFDAGTGDPLPGVNIIIKGTTNGTVTNLDGYYTIDLPTGSNTIVASFIGYKTVEREVYVSDNSTSTQDFSLKEAIQFGWVFKAILINIVWLSIALIYLGIFTQFRLKPKLTTTIPCILIPVSFGIYGIVDIFDSRIYFNVSSIFDILVNVLFVTFALSAFIRKRLQETTLLLAGALILQSLIAIIFNLIGGYFRLYMVIFPLSNLILAGIVLTYAGVYNKIAVVTFFTRKQ